MFGTKWRFNKKGFTIVEIIVVIAIIVSAFIAILSFFAFDSRVSDRGRMRLRATSLIEGATEAVRNFRDNNDWTIDGIGSLIVEVNYHPVMASKSWDILSGSEVIDGFTRSVVFSNVSRDGNDNIEQSYNPFNNDPDTKKIKITVSWTDRNGLTSESLETYLTNWKR